MATFYPLGNRTTIDSYSRMFHFKCCHNILYLNKALFKMSLKNSKLCSLCNSCDETLVHLFRECQVIIHLWNLLRASFPHIPFPDLSSESAFFGFKQDLFINQLHIIFRIAIYNKREDKPSVAYIQNKINSIKKVEENLTPLNPSKKQMTQQNGPG